MKDFTLGGGAETALGSDTHDVVSGDEVKFTSSIPWIPFPVSAIPFLNIAQHYCVVARIAEYSDPGDPTIREITLDNNEAQSNHTQLISVERLAVHPGNRSGAGDQPVAGRGQLPGAGAPDQPVLPHLRRPRVGAAGARRGAQRPSSAPSR